jgi:ABC-type glycerol-3-phosphate transport system substrate-binding protein
MKKLLVSLSVLLLAGGMIFANGKNEELMPANSGAKSAEKTKIVFLRAGTEANKKEAYMKIIEAFEKQNPTIEIEYQESPWGNDIETKLNTGFASGTAADVINYSLASMGQRIPLGQYENLNAYTKGWEGLNDFYPSVLNAGSIGDKLYGIGYIADPRLLVYNKALFAEAGLDPNSPPTNWEELKADHAKLIKKDASGTIIQSGLSMPTMGFAINQWLAIFGYQNGVKNLVDESNNEILFNQPKMVEAATFLKEIRDMGVIPFDSEKMDQNPFANGVAAISYMNPNEFKSINTGALAGKIAMASPLSHTAPGTFCGMHFMFMNSKSKNKDAAWKFMEFLTSRESMQTWSQILGAAPLRKSLESEFLAAHPADGKFQLDAIAAGTGSPKVAYSNTLFIIVNEAMEKIFYGKASVQDALDSAAVKLQKEIDNQ